MLSIIVGIIIIVFSLIGLSNWRADVLIVLKGLMPLLFLGGGIIVVLAGISGIRDNIIQDRKAKEKGN